MPEQASTGPAQGKKQRKRSPCHSDHRSPSRSQTVFSPEDHAQRKSTEDSSQERSQIVYSYKSQKGVMYFQKLQLSVVNRMKSGESLQHVPGSQLPHINEEEVRVIQDEETASGDWHFKRRRGSPERSQRLECK